MFPDEWLLNLFPKYLLMHFIGGYLLLSAFIFGNLENVPSLVLVLIIAFLKEAVYDKMIKKTEFCTIDIVFTMLGTLPLLITHL